MSAPIHYVAGVLVTGPDSGGFDMYGDEFPEWTVCIQDDDGEPVSKIYRCRSYNAAVKLGQRIAHDHRLPLDIEAVSWI